MWKICSIIGIYIFIIVYYCTVVPLACTVVGSYSGLVRSYGGLVRSYGVNLLISVYSTTSENFPETFRIKTYDFLETSRIIQRIFHMDIPLVWLILPTL